MKRFTFQELCHIFERHNKENGVRHQFSDENRLKAVIVFTEGSFGNSDYTKEERSYVVSSDNKMFLSGFCSSSLYGDCLDGGDLGVRLDMYMQCEKNPWQVDHCYLLED